MKNVIGLIIGGIGSGFVMWVIAGLWHNLVLPNVNKNIHPHHEGIGIMLVAYIILGLLMTYLYTQSKKDRTPLIHGLWLGILVGILWTFPHGLAMAATHGTSIPYELKNTLWHMFEQGMGGMGVALICGKFIDGKPPKGKRD